MIFSDSHIAAAEHIVKMHFNATFVRSNKPLGRSVKSVSQAYSGSVTHGHSVKW